ncbi:MAG: DUF1508 domain-containing protein [Coriobacteriales bacterium]
MSRGKFRIGCYGDNRRFRVDLEDDAGTVLLTSQYREQKPMCLNEITWMRAVGAKRANYLLGESQRGKLMFQLVANDGHLLGQSPDFETEQEREQSIQLLMSIARDAETLDEAPVEENREHYHRILHEHALEVEGRKEATKSADCR